MEINSGEISLFLKTLKIQKNKFLKLNESFVKFIINFYKNSNYCWNQISSRFWILH